MLKEKLKQEIDKLNEQQLKKIADFIASSEFQSEVESSTKKQDSTPAQRAAEFREWVSQLPSNNVSLSDEALSRDSIYEE